MKHKALIAVFFLLSGCSSVQSKDSTFTSSMPDWFQEAMKSEATIESSSRLNVSDLNFDDEVLGNFELANQDEGYWYFISEIDGSAAVECYVYTDFDGTANTLYRVIDSVVDFVSGFKAEDDGVPILEQLTAYVDGYIDAPTYIHGFKIASVVARNRSGDCTEYAVLTAALARALSYPARVVFGTAILSDDNSLQAYTQSKTSLLKQSSPTKIVSLISVRNAQAQT